LIVWTEDTQRAIDELENGTESAMKDLYTLIIDRIDQLILRVKAVNLTKLLRNKFITIITVDVHGRDVCFEFKNKIPAIEGDSFDWMKQLRYYYREMEAYELEEQASR
jgi:hypothetical protein